MFPRLPDFRSSSVPRVLLLLLVRSSSCLATMANQSNSTIIPHQSSVENNKASSSASSNDEHSVARDPPRRRIARQGLDYIAKHIRLNDREKPGTVRHSKGKDEPFLDSTHKEDYLKQPKPALAKDSDHKMESSLLPACSDYGLVAKDISRSSSNCADQLSEESCTNDDECLCMLEKNSLPTSFGKPDIYKARKSNAIKTDLKHGAGGGNKGVKSKKCYTAIEPFDICLSDREEMLNRQFEAEDHKCLSSFIDWETEPEPEVNHVSEGSRQGVLRPGMVLLKNYITPSGQVSIVKKCRELGLGPGGFYRPGYKDGAKLRLHMMCLGLDWDPQSRKYQKRRQIDRSQPPHIPSEFHQLVHNAMQDSYALIRMGIKFSKAEEILPPLSPDVCIVNFYTENGRLGLHQDRDESRESLAKGLPVVSFSIGDSAEFLYGDQRDVNKAEKLLLESGDVLIFGGQSRHVFHGVACIIPNSAPNFLLQETRLRPGRLNLTFRQS